MVVAQIWKNLSREELKEQIDTAHHFSPEDFDTIVAQQEGIDRALVAEILEELRVEEEAGPFQETAHDHHVGSSKSKGSGLVIKSKPKGKENTSCNINVAAKSDKRKPKENPRYKTADYVVKSIQRKPEISSCSSPIDHVANSADSKASEITSTSTPIFVANRGRRKSRKTSCCNIPHQVVKLAKTKERVITPYGVVQSAQGEPKATSGCGSPDYAANLAERKAREIPCCSSSTTDYVEKSSKRKASQAELDQDYDRPVKKAAKKGVKKVAQMRVRNVPAENVPAIERDLRREFVEKVEELGGKDVRLIGRTELTATDVNKDQRRLLLRELLNDGFLTSAEDTYMDYGKIQAKLLEPSKLHEVQTTGMNKTQMRSNKYVTLWKPWWNVCQSNNFKASDVIQIWSFRYGNEGEVAEPVAEPGFEPGGG